MNPRYLFLRLVKRRGAVFVPALKYTEDTPFGFSVKKGLSLGSTVEAEVVISGSGLVKVT